MSFRAAAPFIKLQALLLCGFLFFYPWPAFAQNTDSNGDLDSLFDEAPEDIVAEDTQTDHLSQFQETEKMKVSGHFTAKGGAAFGWESLPESGGSLADGLGFTPGARSLARLTFDSRPSAVFQVYGSFYTEIDPSEGENNWSEPVIDELFSDYNWLDKAFIRMGKHRITWGQGRIYTPGDLMSASDDGVAFRVSMPTLLDGISFVSLLDESFAGEDESLSAKDLAYGALADKIFGRVRLSAGTRYQKDRGLTSLASFKTVLWKTDLLSDFVLHYNDDEFDFETIAGFFREWPEYKLYGEYYFNGKTVSDDDHNIGLAGTYKNIFSTPLDFGIEWLHAFMNDSGRLTTGVSWKPWKLVKASIGVPFFYGNYENRYEEDDDVDLLSERKLSFAFFLELSSSF
ncbi:MAG: hypothetical protein RBT69_11565 [Spirochaetia bacterium]|jgi:hypothetical protein|nr:hypothetical protein [Spirochaetia bacterium]